MVLYEWLNDRSLAVAAIAARLGILFGTASVITTILLFGATN